MLTSVDKKCLDLAIQEAQKSFNEGNYPVGATLYIDDDNIFSIGNAAKDKDSLFFHAENSLIMKYGKEMYSQFKRGGDIKIYSTLEPCLMCLGAAVLNKVTNIHYIQKDPHAGACNIDTNSLGIRYEEIWPKIEHVEYSNVPLDLLIKFFNREIEDGNQWGEKMLDLFGIIVK